MEKVVIEFTENELQALGQLLHIAVQARGLDVAEAAVVLTKKITSHMPSKNGAAPPMPSMVPMAKEPERASKKPSNPAN